MSRSTQLILAIGRSLAWRERGPGRAGPADEPELTIEPGTPSRSDDTPTRGIAPARK